MTESGEVEVNGKVDLGTRRLVLSHVENATTFYAYQEADKGFMKEVEAAVRQQCEGLARLSASPTLDQMVGVYTEQAWYRGKVEQLAQGRQRNLLRVRMVDHGWNNLFRPEDLCELPDGLKEKKVLCEKYKMADLKPRGKVEGYSAEDRQRGAEWLKRLVNNRVVICSCHRQVKYAGGIMADCMVGDINLNKAALKQGHAILNPGIIANSIQKNGQNPYPQNQFSNQFAYGGGAASAGTVDLDYSTYGGASPFNGTHGSRGRNGHVAQPRPLRSSPAGAAAPNVKSHEVKKLEKKINEDKKIINELKKTTNLDAGIKDIVRLMDKVNQARGKDPEKESKGNYIVSCLVGVAEVIEQSSLVTEQFLAGVEAVEAAARRVSEAEKDEQKDKATQSKTDLHRCIQQYLSVYNDQVVEDELGRVTSQLTAMESSIPSSWRLLAVKPEVVTRVNLLEVAENVKNWMEASVSREAAVAANTKKEVESLCRNLSLLSESLQQKLTGAADIEVPKSIDSQLGAARAALQAELLCRNGGKLSSARKGKDSAASDDAKVLRSAWKALTALKNQLEIAKNKRTEYENMASSLAPLLSQ